MLLCESIRQSGNWCASASSQGERGARAGSRWSLSSLVLVAVVASFAGQSVALTPAQEFQVQTVHEGRPIAQWIDDWRTARDLHSKNQATAALVRAGEAAVPQLLEVLQAREPIVEYVFECAARMGPAAEPLLEEMTEALRDRSLGEGAPEGRDPRSKWISKLRYGPWTSTVMVPILAALFEDEGENPNVRKSALSVLGHLDGSTERLASWAHDELRDREHRVIAVRALGDRGAEAIPALRELIEATSDDEGLRQTAVYALRGKGELAIEVLRPLLPHFSGDLEATAHSTMAGLLEEAGETTRAAYFAKLVRQDPYTDTRDRLWRSRVMVDQVQVQDPDLARFAYMALLERLQSEPTVEHALLAASVAQDFLVSTCLHLRKGNSDETWGRVCWPRALPEVGFAQIARLLEQAYELAPADSAKATELAVALAKTALLQGEWEEMLHWIEASGQTLEPLPASQRTAPPVDWTDLARSWTLCDEELRGGEAQFTLQVQREGQAVRGVHVRLEKTELPGRNRVFSTGYRIDSLGHAPYPLPSVFDPYTFGYGGDDRGNTRYVVTDETGVAHFDALPEGFYELEVLIPSGNFDSPVSEWELWMQDAGDEWSPVRGLDTDPVWIVGGSHYRYPMLEVRPRFRLDMEPWEALDRHGHRLEWTPIHGTVKSVVTVSLSCPEESDNAQYADAIRRVEVETADHFLVVGASKDPTDAAVVGMPLIPGNVYLFSVECVDATGKALARSRVHRGYVPWNHRPMKPPYQESSYQRDSLAEPPVGVRNWHLGTFSSPEIGVLNNRERLDGYLAQAEDGFEVPYAKVVRAWLYWHDGETQRARELLGAMVQILPEGNVARDTAARVLAGIEAGDRPGKELRFSQGGG